MDNSVLVTAIETYFGNQVFLQWLADILLKSALVILLAWLVISLWRRQLSSSNRHLIWFSVVKCVVLLPVVSVLQSQSGSAVTSGSNTAQYALLSVVNVPAAATVDTTDWFLLAYIGVCLMLLARLVVSAVTLQSINHNANFINDENIVTIADKVRNTLGINRRVTYKQSGDIKSPISFGCINPVVVLPNSALGWATQTMEDVLIHELSHVKRLDWLSMLFCQVVTCLLWLNPLVWLARNRLLEAAEQACDSAIVQCGNDGIRYAEDLLRLSREVVQQQRVNILAQSMFTHHALASRIRSLVDGPRQVVSNRILGLLSAGVMVLSLGACSSFGLFGVTAADGDYFPLVAAVPQYPTRAAEEQIEGWCLVSFTVTPEGLVDADTIRVVDAEPADIFDRTSQRAAEKFTFQPRIQGGRPVAVPEVQYLFRFELTEDSMLENVRRPPPPARKPRAV